MSNMTPNTNGIQVLTPNGWQDFRGVAKMGTKMITRVEFVTGEYIECSSQHKLFNTNGGEVSVDDLVIGDKIAAEHSDVVVANIINTKQKEETYDLIEVAGGNRYYTNGILSSNCSFITGDATLISAQKLAVLNHLVRPPKFIDKWGCRWFEEIKPNVGYGVVLDPSQGVGLDDACIQVVEIPSLIQVAEWNDNNADQRDQALMLKRVLKRLYAVQQNDPEHSGEVNIYYSVERNGLGIGILNIIDLEGEETFPGWLLDSTATSINVRGNSAGGDSQNRWRGLITTVSSKKRYCLEYKSLVERNLFTPRSATLASQMKTFVKNGNSWAAKSGTKDDVIMGQVLMCHLIDELRYHEPDLEDMLRLNLDETYDPDDAFDPDNMPFLPIL